MFIAVLKTKNNEEFTINSETFGGAWNALHKLSEKTESSIEAAEVFEEGEGIDDFTLIASMRIVK